MRRHADRLVEDYALGRRAFVNYQNRNKRYRTRMNDSVGVSFRTGAAIDIYAAITKQNKKDAANALIWEALSQRPDDLAAVLAELPKLQERDEMEHPRIDWGKDAASMTDEEKAAVLAAAERQSFRISDLLVRLAEQRGEVAGG